MELYTRDAKRYEDLKEFSLGLEDGDVDELRPSASKDFDLSKILTTLKDLEPVSKASQADKVTSLFDAFIDSFPQTWQRLACNASIVHSPGFESGVIKVQLGEQSALDRNERATLKMFEQSVDHEEQPVEKVISFAERALKKD